MATRISGSSGLSGKTLIDFLLRKTTKREDSKNLIGLQRSLALSDVESPGDALNNFLEKISRTDLAERDQYGRPFSIEDWSVTENFTGEGINKSFLEKLSEASVGGGSLGSTVSTTPRIRIQDRINFLNSLYGESSFSGLHSGPDAQFYKDKGPQTIGYIRFNFNVDTGSINNVLQLLEPDNLTGLILQEDLVVDLVEYETSDGYLVGLSGLGISLKFELPGSWSVYNSFSLSGLRGIASSIPGPFSDLKFKMTRPYSILNKPKWFSQSPNEDTFAPGGADDLNPVTSPRVLIKRAGEIVPLVEKSSWSSREYVESRWTATEYSLLTNYFRNEVIIAEDSNMRWKSPPTPLSDEDYNWGIRWNGYLRLEPGQYILQVQTNVKVKIDLAINSGENQWQNVFDTDGNSLYTGEDDKYFSETSFSLSREEYKYYYSLTEWEAYVPFTVRMFHGSSDRLNPEITVPKEPDLFIKILNKGGSTNSYYRETVEIVLSQDVNTSKWVIAFNSTDSEDRFDEIFDSPAAVEYKLIAFEGTALENPTTHSVTKDLSLGYILEGFTGTEGSYTLSIDTNTGIFDFTESLWKGLIQSPTARQKNYPDLLYGSSNYSEPNIRKVSFDFRPDFWKVIYGSPYNLKLPENLDNTPLDGALDNVFSQYLKSKVEGLGYYGTVLGTYYTKDSIIVGESRYSSSEELGSNYTGIVLRPNRLGVGGKLIANALPINKTGGSDDINSGILTRDYLGGYEELFLTTSRNKVAKTFRYAQLYLSESTNPDSQTYNKYYPSTKVYPSRSNFPTSAGERAGIKTYIDDETKNLWKFDNQLNDYIRIQDQSEIPGASVDFESYGGFPIESEAWLSPVSASAAFISFALSDNLKTNFEIYNNSLSIPATGGIDRYFYLINSDSYYVWSNANTYVEFNNNISNSPINELTCPLSISIEKRQFIDSDDNIFYLPEFSTNQASLLTNGVDVDLTYTSPYTSNTYDLNLWVYYLDSEPTFEYLFVDSGKSLSFTDVLKLTYGENEEFIGSLSEIPRPTSDRISPFGNDKPSFSNGLCYPPYFINNTILSNIAISDNDLYSKPLGNYDTIWGDITKPNLGDKYLEITEKIEFQDYEGGSAKPLATPVALSYSDYTHRFKIELPLPGGAYDPDMLVHIGNGERVKEPYYAYIRLDS